MRSVDATGDGKTRMRTWKRWTLAIGLPVGILATVACGIGAYAFIVVPRAGLMDVAGDWCEQFGRKSGSAASAEFPMIDLGTAGIPDEQGGGPGVGGLQERRLAEVFRVVEGAQVAVHHQLR